MAGEQISAQWSGVPDWYYTDYVAPVLGAGGALAQQDYVPYQGPRIAEFTPEQLASFNLTQAGLGTWQPYADLGLEGLGKAQQFMGGAGEMISGGAQFDPAAYNQFWDIYRPGFDAMSQTIQNIGRRNFVNTTLADLNDAFVGGGGFGGGRHQILGADAAATAQSKIEDAKNAAYLNARQQAMGDYGNWAQRGIQGGQAMGMLGQQQQNLGTGMFNFGTAQQQAVAQDAAALAGIGQQQQQMNQRNLDLSYQDFQEQLGHPWSQLNKWTTLGRNVQLPSTTVQQSTPVSSTTQGYQNPWVAGTLGGLGMYGAQTQPTTKPAGVP